MYLNKININNFKNLNIDFDLSPHINILIKDNGWGKTNFLEAIDYIPNLKSFRSVSDIELFNWNESKDFFKISIILKDINEKNYEVVVSREDDIISKKCFIDKSLVSTSKFKSYFKTLLYSPHLSDFVSSAPEIRRKFFDKVILNLYDNYEKFINEYKFILKSRNKLLKERKNVEELKYWNMRLLKTGEEIIAFRLKFINDLDRYVQESAKKVYGNIYKSFAIEYISNVIDGKKRIIFSSIQKEYLSKELEFGMSLYGPHRDDFSFELNGINLRKFGSRAQQRLAGLVLYVALINFVNETQDKKIVLLFDDIFSELDDNFRDFMQDVLSNLDNQIILTTTSEKIFTNKFLKNARIL